MSTNQVHSDWIANEQELITEGLNLVFALRLSRAKTNARRQNFHAARVSLGEAQVVLSAQENRTF